MKKLLRFDYWPLAAFAAEGYKIINKIKIGGTGGWDYLAVDPATQRLYASHGGIVEVVDTEGRQSRSDRLRNCTACTASRWPAK